MNWWKVINNLDASHYYHRYIFFTIQVILICDLNYGELYIFSLMMSRILQCFHLVLHAHKIQIWLCIKVKPRGNTRIRNSVVLMRIENLSFMFSLWDLNAYVEMTIQLQTHYSHFMVTVILTLYVCTQSLSIF